VFEDRLLVAADQAGGRRFPARISVVARFILHQGWLKLRGRYHRHGYAAVSFGAPMSLRAYQADHPEGGVEGLARALMARIGAEVPVLPVPLVARALLLADAPLSREALDTRIAAMLEEAPRAHLHLPRDDLAYAIRFGITVLRKRGMIEERRGAFSVIEAERPLLTYYAASIAHLFRGRSRD
jgi:glycerol-3-phosphate O-acyltransferase